MEEDEERELLEPSTKVPDSPRLSPVKRRLSSLREFQWEHWKRKAGQTSLDADILDEDDDECIRHAQEKGELAGRKAFEPSGCNSLRLGPIEPAASKKLLWMLVLQKGNG